jgi:hypothetical protein
MNNIRRYNRYFLNEAVERTIDKKLWASVSSGISRTYRQDMGASAKPLGTRDQLLQKYIAALVQLKQPCPSTVDELRNSPAFPQWGKWLANNGVAIEEVQQLYNENCGKLPKAVIGGSSASIAQPSNNSLFDTTDDVEDVEENEEDDDDDLGFALGMTDDEYQEMKRQKAMARQQRRHQQTAVNKPQPQVIDTDDDFDTDEDDILDNQPIVKQDYDNVTSEDEDNDDWADDDDEEALNNIEDDSDEEYEEDSTIEDDSNEYEEDTTEEDPIEAEEVLDDVEDDDLSVEDEEPVSVSKPTPVKSDVPRKNLGSFTKKSADLKAKLFVGTIYSKDNFFKSLDGCQDPDDALTPLTANQLGAEGINKSDALVDLKALMRDTSFCYAMRVYGDAGPIIENDEIVGIEGDVIWSDNPTSESYYIVAGDNRVVIFFKDHKGNLTEVYDASFEEFGFSA